MGILLGSKTSLLVILAQSLLLLLLNLSFGLGSLGEDVCEVTPDSEYSIKKINFIAVKYKETLPPNALTLTAIESCDLMMSSCETCLRLRVSLNAPGYTKIRGLVVQILEANSNYSMKITKKQKTNRWKLWMIQIDCCSVALGQTISASLFTLPRYILGINKTYFIRDPEAKPEFDFKHSSERGEIEVFVSQGPEANARLCYQNSFCNSLNRNENELEYKVAVSRNLTLKYDYLLPCLCLEVFYDGPNSLRNQICPFYEHDAAYNQDFWNISVLETYDHSSMLMGFNKKCNLQPDVSVCRKRESGCISVPDAVVKMEEYVTEEDCILEYKLDSADRDPHLCFKFNVSNKIYVKCPGVEDRIWDVTMEMQLFDTLLTVFLRAPSAYSAVICKPNNVTKQCDPESPVYAFMTENKSFGKVTLSIPKPGMGSCVQVWRSDVHFSHKYLLCPDFLNKHLGLLVLGTALLALTLVLFLLLMYKRIWKIFTAPLWQRTILLVYSPDSPEYKNLMCAFADFLQSILGCEVILDLWDMTTISQIGMLPWFYQKRELVSERKGNVILVWTKRSMCMYEQWKNRNLTSLGWKDPANLFGAAMSCLHKDLKVKDEEETLKNYTMVYFEGLCDKQDIPTELKKLSRFCLFKDFYQLVSNLQDTPCLPPHCLIKAVAKYFMRKLISSERSMGLKRPLELCRQKLHEGIG
ncbi:interleukin-17 receptor E [Pelodytes ibericus]